MHITDEMVLAIDNNNINLLELLLSNAQFDNNNSTDLILYSIKANNINIVKFLLKNKALIIEDSEANWLMKAALQQQKTNIFSLLLTDKRLDPSSCNQSVLTCALGMSNIVAVKLLLEDKRINLTHNTEQLFSIVKIQNNNEIILMLMNNKIISSSLKKINLNLYNKFIEKKIKHSINHF